MQFFDFLYYYIYSWYNNYEKSSGPEGAACFAVAGFQIFNLLSIYMIIAISNHYKFDISKLVLILLYTGLAVFNYLRYVYPDKKQAQIEERWNSTSEKRKVELRSFMRTYILTSIFLFFGSAIILARRAG